MLGPRRLWGPSLRSPGAAGLGYEGSSGFAGPGRDTTAPLVGRHSGGEAGGGGCWRSKPAPPGLFRGSVVS